MLKVVDRIFGCLLALAACGHTRNNTVDSAYERDFHLVPGVLSRSWAARNAKHRSSRAAR